MGSDRQVREGRLAARVRSPANKEWVLSVVGNSSEQTRITSRWCKIPSRDSTRGLPARSSKRDRSHAIHTAHDDKQAPAESTNLNRKLPTAATISGPSTGWNVIPSELQSTPTPRTGADPAPRSFANDLEEHPQ